MIDKNFFDADLFKKVLVQLIRSDGMSVTNDYLISQGVYYIDNTGVIEELERLLMEYYFVTLLNDCESVHSVSKSKLFSLFSPQFINYDFFFDELMEKYCSDGREGSVQLVFDVESGKFI